MASGLTSRETRVLNPRPRRHHRPQYSRTEFRLGLGIVALLGLIGGWVGWRGAHPDPATFGEGDGVTIPAGMAKGVDRGPLPAALALAGWAESGLARFEAANLYEKIDGRADYFLSRGFRSLTYVNLAAGAATVDVELYDLASPENALSALAGERPAGSSGPWSLSRNALLLARGPYYLRAIGSDESAAVVAQLQQVRAALEKAVAAGERPFSHVLFGDALGVPAERVAFQAENAFSFGFAKDVHVATLDDAGAEAFVTAAASPEAAKAMAAQFEKGFLEYGERAGEWVKDQYLGTFAGARSEGPWVLGVRGAASTEQAAGVLQKLRPAVASVAPPAAKVASGAGGPAHE